MQSEWPIWYNPYSLWRINIVVLHITPFMLVFRRKQLTVIRWLTILSEYHFLEGVKETNEEQYRKNHF